MSKLLSSIHAEAQLDPRVKSQIILQEELGAVHQSIKEGLEELDGKIPGGFSHQIQDFDANHPKVVVNLSSINASKGTIHIVPSLGSNADTGTVQVFRTDNGSGGKLSEHGEAGISAAEAEDVLNTFIFNHLNDDVKVALAATSEIDAKPTLK